MRNPWLWTISLLGLGACNAQQSALHVFGAEARQVREMAILLTIGAAIILSIMILIYVRALRAPEGALSHHGGMRIILWLGAIGPAVAASSAATAPLNTCPSRTL